MPNPPNGLAQRYQTALVTGASSGIGQAIATRLLKEGLQVYGTSRQPEAAGRDPAIRWLAFDGGSRDGINQFIQGQANLLSNIDVLINNAGSSCFGSVDDLPTEAIASQHQLLLEAPVQLTRAVLPGMRLRGRGAVINISSLAAIFPLPYMATYSAGKAGLSAFTESLMLTEKGRGLVLIDFKAGDFRTAFNANTRRYGDLDASRGRAWQKLEAHLAAAPEPAQAAEDLVRALQRGRSRTVRSGGCFQAWIAPLGVRLLPRRLILWAIGKYYHLGGQ